jgi:hypothetical protein
MKAPVACWPATVPRTQALRTSTSAASAAADATQESSSEAESIVLLFNATSILFQMNRS